MPNPYEEKKEEREREARQRERRSQLRRLARRAMWGAVAFAFIALILIWGKTLFPQDPDRSQAFEIQGQDHIPFGSPHPEYNSDPPTSGWHYAEPAAPGFYDQELPDEQLVHNLEHGEIWISYRPGVSQEVLDELRDMVGVFVIVTKRAANDADIALAAWGRLDKFNLENGALDRQRVKDFILRYQDKGPEKVHSIAP